eukprot:snap_masked-scaffold57_size444674-processed-gene-0.11 protein:Tk04358 transcript:snap_masked-scaffold57_size444674-processed-gene-0.11-mRNA-1 annotation:"smad nuclear interacting protein 1"
MGSPRRRNRSGSPDENRQRRRSRSRERRRSPRAPRDEAGAGRGRAERPLGRPVEIKTEAGAGRGRTERHLGRPTEIKTEPEVEVEKQGPNFEVSGKLMEDTNTFNGVVIKYSEPAEARRPKKRWRFYVFKGEESLPVLHLHRQSAFLMGKDRKIVDLPIDHPSCSRQHAVLQYRMVKSRVLPYIIDLGSSNGTFLNNQKIEAKRYYELREKDVLKFGFSSREYVLLHDQSQDPDEAD